MIFSKRRAYNGRPTIGRSKDGVRLVGFKYQKGYDWLDLNSKQEGVRLVGFRYQKADDWLDSKFHCSYLESRGIPGKTRKKPREILSLFVSGDVISGDATSGCACARDHFR